MIADQWAADLSQAFQPAREADQHRRRVIAKRRATNKQARTSRKRNRRR